MQFARAASDGDKLEIGVARDQQEAGGGLEEFRAGLARIGTREEIEQRVGIELARTLHQHEREPGHGLGDQANATVGDRILLVALARECGVIAWRPARPSLPEQREQRAGARGFLL